MAFVSTSTLVGGPSKVRSVCGRRAAVSMVATAPSQGKGAVETSPVWLVADEDDFDRIIDESEDEVVVLKVFAPWCRACAKLAPMYEAIAPQYPNLKFTEVNFAENRDLCRRLGVKAMPTFQFFDKSAGRVENFSCGPKRFPELVERLQQFEKGYCQYPKEE
mmetsp:Transcript_9356/g.28188  ORF Transcript_9356/g.28188 Transcript_9356/m.28188 type:complete len:162 (-) Transcript_9356:174-659(-)|eukprot:CAMPEP_0198727250 /NCGR_PEP_ID=MMETSP1475-20131203/4035_1 /TAXON_ID= ORGANISM="Unidentified sp., Strain CCMP1999" /NCGR_SAMPLE_ID=MMETSP1475 /ASSEMBLY_ACC=CAM_ASM_001111 /LENGTH=161 /DNA_ID=CAMNT_0044489261 /DNA_START=89 /DNA_END=574 /DNA_ORIENTATION=+